MPFDRPSRRSFSSASRSSLFLAGTVAVGATLTGCNLYRPGLTEPRTIEQQRFAGSLHDPYPLPDVGPEMVGVRPRDFQNPYAEPVRDRWFAESWWGR